ncbi:hypothetical protein M0R72_02345 [Candidatus Pacearchaeota archaeon]|jgi:hypothetical protein|nr:hypothetical protein [Candidatus Pacearchaeota archaeon]
MPSAIADPTPEVVLVPTEDPIPLTIVDPTPEVVATPALEAAAETVDAPDPDTVAVPAAVPEYPSLVLVTISRIGAVVEKCTHDCSGVAESCTTCKPIPQPVPVYV